MAKSAGTRRAKTYLGALCVALAAVVSPIAARASLIGDTVSCNITGGGIFTCSSATAVVVNPGVEFQVGILPGSPIFNVDFRSTDVLITALSTFFLGGTIINLADLTNPLTGASLLSSSGISNFSAANVSLSGGTLSVNLDFTSGGAGATIDIGLTTAEAVPEPGSLSLLGGALIALAVLRRRRGVRD